MSSQLIESISLPSNLRQVVRVQFDDLLAKGEIIWRPYEAQNAEQDGFKIQFQTAPHLVKKPMNHADSVQRKPGPGKNPFINPDPAFVVSRLGTTHTLLLNKFPVYRDSLIVHTNEFQLQSDDLDARDLSVAWACLEALQPDQSDTNGNGERNGGGNASENREWMMTYNCGVDAGCSQGHKHMQLWPLPTEAELGFPLFPSTVEFTNGNGNGNGNDNGVHARVSGVPHQHFVLRLSSSDSRSGGDGGRRGGAGVLKELVASYGRLLREVRKCHQRFQSTGYNVAMTREWMCVVPRRHSGVERGTGASTPNMLGLVWVNGEWEMEKWLKPSLSEHMGFLGVPLDMN